MDIEKGDKKCHTQPFKCYFIQQVVKTHSYENFLASRDAFSTSVAVCVYNSFTVMLI